MKNWEWYQDVPVKVLFLHLLLEANHEDRNWQGITVHRGQTITSIRKLAMDTGLTIKQVRVALDKLKRTHEIVSQGHSKYTLITVENYAKFQGKPTEEGQTKGTQEGEQRANEGQTKGNKQEYKEYKNNKEYIYIVGQVIDYLNEKTGKNFSAKADANKKLIVARLNEGYQEEDFKKVIDNKYIDWQGTTYETYMRPSTLFAKSHFDDYLNCTPRKKESSNPFLNILGEMA